MEDVSIHNLITLVFFYIQQQHVPIIDEVVSSNSSNGEVYSKQHYVIKFVSDFRKVGGFLRVLRFPPIKLIATK